MKKEVEEQTNVVELIKEEAAMEYHSESLCTKGNHIFITASAESSPNNGYSAIKSLQGACYLHHSLVVTDAVGY